MFVEMRDDAQIQTNEGVLSQESSAMHVGAHQAYQAKAPGPTDVCCRFPAILSPIQVGDVVEAQRRRIVFMLLKGNIYGLPGSDGTVRQSLRGLPSPFQFLNRHHM